VNRVAAHWDRFWHTPTSTLPAAILRIVFGAVVFLWALSMLEDVYWFFGPHGVLPEQLDRPGILGFLGRSDSPLLPAAALGALMVAGVLLAIGCWTRVVSVVVFVLIAAFHHRNPFVLNGGDLLMRLAALYIALTPTGAALSVDRWRRNRAEFWSHPERPMWGLRLLQLQVAVMYFDSVWEKIVGETWRAGTAVGFALANDELTRTANGDWIGDVGWLNNILTWSTLLIEFALALLVWNRRLRPWVLLGGVALHLGIELGMPLGFFPVIVLTTYLSFLTPSGAERVVAGARALPHLLRQLVAARAEGAVPAAGTARRT
jgi:uncharacterized membrane protein YphA (DoxX/SURF4 family)